MSKKVKEACRILSQEAIAKDVYSMWLESAGIAAEAVPGQFLSLYCRDGSRVLPRPISLCEIDRERGLLRIVYRVAGKGTDEFSRLTPGHFVQVMGPLGNGFPLDRAEGKRILLIGGGIGVPPMVETARQIPGEKILIAGFKDETFLMKEMQKAGTLYAATEDGSCGTKGTVLDVIEENGLQADVIFACGPTPMLGALKAYAKEHSIECWISMEEKMACGIGACLACVCKSAEEDSHSHVHNKRICKDGPVFLSTEVEL